MTDRITSSSSGDTTEDRTLSQRGAAPDRGHWLYWPRQIFGLFRVQPFDTTTAEGRSLERYRRIAWTAVSGLGAQAISMVIGLITVPLVLSYLGKERYGLWGTIANIVAWATLFDFGLATGLVNCIARAHGREDRDEAGRYLSTAFAALFVVASVLGTLLPVGMWHVPWSSYLSVRGAVDDATVTWSVVAALGMFLLGLPLTAVPQLYAGYQKAYFMNAFGLVGSAFSLIGLLLVVRKGGSMPMLILASASSSVVSSGLALIYALRKAMPWLKVRVRGVSMEALRGLGTRSAPIFLFQLSALAINACQPFILNRRCGLTVTADYQITMGLSMLLSSLIQIGTASFIPPFREAHERGDRTWMRVGFRRFLFIRVGLGALGGLGFVLTGNWLLRLWLRRSDLVFSQMLWVVLGVLLVASLWVSAYGELLRIMDRLWLLAVLALLNGAVTVPLTWALSAPYGVLGAAMAISAVTVLVNTWLLPLFARQVLAVPPVLQEQPSP